MIPKEECEELMNALLPFGVDLLKRNKGFYPFAAVMNMDGTIKQVAFYDGDDKPNSKELLTEHKNLCKNLAARNEIKASGIVWDGSTVSDGGKKQDAIIVSLEHMDGYSVQVALPYKIGFLKKPQFGDLFAVEGEHDVFQNSDPALTSLEPTPAAKQR